MDPCRTCGGPKAEKNKSYCSNACKAKGNRKTVDPKPKAVRKSAYQMMAEGMAEARRRGWDAYSFHKEFSAYLGYMPTGDA